MGENKNDWRTIQIFMANQLNKKDELEVSEVSLSAHGPSNMRCTCRIFEKFKDCQHVEYVATKIEINGGSFGLLIPSDIPDDWAYDAFTDADSSRNFILRYGKIEVM